MSGVSFPGPGQDGEQPPPGDPARDETGADDFDLDAAMVSFLAGIEAGREQIPDPFEEVPACAVSLGEACGVDIAELAGMCGPQAPTRPASPANAGRDRSADGIIGASRPPAGGSSSRRRVS